MVASTVALNRHTRSLSSVEVQGAPPVGRRQEEEEGVVADLTTMHRGDTEVVPMPPSPWFSTAMRSEATVRVSFSRYPI